MKLSILIPFIHETEPAVILMGETFNELAGRLVLWMNEQFKGGDEFPPIYEALQEIATKLADGEKMPVAEHFDMGEPEQKFTLALDTEHVYQGPVMNKMRWRWETLGGHTHVDVFMNGANCGHLIFNNTEFRVLQVQHEADINFDRR